MTKIKSPIIIDKVFSENDYSILNENLFKMEKRKEWYDDAFGRYHYSSELISDYSKKLIPLAKQIFESQSLVPSYSLFSHYEGDRANLFKHKDDNACTYTIDMCVYQNQPWDIWVDNNAYTLNPNQALAYYGNDQEHWREAFPDPKNQYVGMIFFHFVEPDHWYLTEGPDYIHKIRSGN